LDRSFPRSCQRVLIRCERGLVRTSDIDIKDLQKVFGRDGSTCQQPLPPQPPAPPPAPFG
jgi:hypothetical protein